MFFRHKPANIINTENRVLGLRAWAKRCVMPDLAHCLSKVIVIVFQPIYRDLRLFIIQHECRILSGIQIIFKL